MSSSSVVSRDAGKTPAPILSAPLDSDFIDAMTRDERSVLVYAETCLVDGGGLLDARRMNEADHEALTKFRASGLLDYGRIPSGLLGTHGFTQSNPTHWVEFSDEAWVLAHELRRRLSARRGPYATKVFAEVADRLSDGALGRQDGQLRDANK